MIVRHTGEIKKKNIVSKLLQTSIGYRDSNARFPHPAGSADGNEALRREHLGHVHTYLIAPDQRRRPYGKIVSTLGCLIDGVLLCIEWQAKRCFIGGSTFGICQLARPCDIGGCLYGRGRFRRNLGTDDPVSATRRCLNQMFVVTQ
ncbi:hypothetical protein [Robbsia andropogonis]|uniref:hypothetical protein n=1 Tax=Robbsia andropogonis TaxID=28092 RepID=UPI001F38E739|nr:hypothetical protein [Robbsia andropogonis]